MGADGVSDGRRAGLPPGQDAGDVAATSDLGRVGHDARGRHTVPVGRLGHYHSVAHSQEEEELLHLLGLEEQEEIDEDAEKKRRGERQMLQQSGRNGRFQSR